MGLLFRPRRPVMRLVADAGGLASDGDERERWLADRLVPAVHASARGDVTQLSDLFTDARGFAEWVVTARHTGPLVVDETLVVPPSGHRVTFRGVTVSEFRGDKISSFRQYWDELELLEGLGLIPRD